jgi:hypothetical protein
MEIGEWILMGSGGATFLLAIAAFWAVLQNYKFQNREKRERLLNEIIEWAINILKLNSDLLSFTESVRLDISLTRTLDKLSADAVALRDKGKYIIRVADVAGGKASDGAIKLQNELTDIADLLDSARITNEISGEEDAKKLITTEDAMLEDTGKNQDTVEKHRKKMAPLCNLIIEEAAQAKLQIIG